jgi:hypothetical protein
MAAVCAKGTAGVDVNRTFVSAQLIRLSKNAGPIEVEFKMIAVGAAETGGMNKAYDTGCKSSKT